MTFLPFQEALRRARPPWALLELAVDDGHGGDGGGWGHRSRTPLSGSRGRGVFQCVGRRLVPPMWRCEGRRQRCMQVGCAVGTTMVVATRVWVHDGDDSQ
jgi:hypothetical protein